MAHYDNDSKIQQIVSQIRMEATSAERAYERAVSRIEIRAAGSIDISQMNQALDIIADSKKALDQLYTTYESLVRTLDMQCRPLAEQGASATAIKEVYDLIAHMNSESSSLSGNFTASVNSYSLGDVGGLRYVASLEAQTIERNWQTRYTMAPDRREAEARKRQADAEAARRRAEQRRQQEAARAEAERKAAEEAKKAEALRFRDRANMEKVVRSCHAQIWAFEVALHTQVQQRKIALKQELQQKLAQLEAQLQTHVQALAGLGVFQFQEKKAQKQEIERLENRIFAFRDPTLVCQAVDQWEAQAQQAVAQYRQAVQAYLDRRFPNQKKENPYQEAAQAGDCPKPPDVETVLK